MTNQLPDRVETVILLDSFGADLEKFQANPDAAAKYLSYGESSRDEHLNASESAAYTSVASLIPNLNQTVTKE